MIVELIIAFLLDSRKFKPRENNSLYGVAYPFLFVKLVVVYAGRGFSDRVHD